MSTPSSPPLSPTRSRTPLPRQSTSTPLRPTSPTSIHSSSTPTGAFSPRRSSNPSPLVHNGPLPSTPPPGDRPKTRARDLLRKHYGLGVGPPPPLPGKADPMDLGEGAERRERNYDTCSDKNRRSSDADSTAFDAKSYYEQLITTSSLPTLIRRENELLTEIRQLDSERQSLVYNHHHELIAASDTIAAMKSRAENLDADLDLLRAAFSEISRLSAEITGEHS
ncbi:uncharacterized protein FIBRA_06411 [Fibroporia radiculosa]|uniref:Vacuolar protein sorting-associated protein 51 homolog n=1 Tax=Fibroporia radiculosa TaxID=599839 RepID=J4H423_9APHY|nr:uncharacterized protein FIBRA_06411 [Fibroporia radiculosa]CCM04244.1 predicted protein [Fibroporia radiculosa]